MLKSNYPIFIVLILGMTSCRPRSCSFQEALEIPCQWQTTSDCGVNTADPACFRWWEALQDPLLTTLINQATVRNPDIRLARSLSKEEWLQTVNTTSVEVAKNYIELRAIQMRLKVVNENKEAQNKILTLNKGLSTQGFFGSLKENEDTQNLDALFVQKFSLELALKKTMFHLSTLLGYPPGYLSKTLCQSQDLPALACSLPIGLPKDLICHNRDVQDARKLYQRTRNKSAFLHYQKTLFSVLENAEGALAAFNYERQKVDYLENTKDLVSDSYKSIEVLYKQGLKDDSTLLTAYQAYLAAEDAWIQGKMSLLNSYIDLYYTLANPWKRCCR